MLSIVQPVMIEERTTFHNEAGFEPTTSFHLANFTAGVEPTFSTTLSVEPATSFFTAEVGLSPWLLHEGTTADEKTHARCLLTKSFFDQSPSFFVH